MFSNTAGINRHDLKKHKLLMPSMIFKSERNQKFEGIGVICVAEPDSHIPDYCCREGEREHGVRTQLFSKLVVTSGLHSTVRT